jgi:hypothetical protein
MDLGTSSSLWLILGRLWRVCDSRRDSAGVVHGLLISLLHRTCGTGGIALDMTTTFRNRGRASAWGLMSLRGFVCLLVLICFLD